MKNSRRYFIVSFYAIAILLLSLPAVLVMLPDEEFTDPLTAIPYGKKVGESRVEQYGYELKLLREPGNLEFHYNALLARHKAQEKGIAPERFNLFDERVDAEKFYAWLQKGKTTALRDAGYFGSACLSLFQEKQKENTQGYLKKISGQRKPFVQFLYAETEQSSPVKERLLLNEIQNKGNIEGATAALAEYYYINANEKGLFTLHSNEETSAFLPHAFRQYLFLKRTATGKYLLSELKQYFRKEHLSGFILCLLIFVAWFLLINRLSLYGLKWNIIYAASCYLIFLLLTPLFYNVIHNVFQFRQNGDHLHDFAYYVAAIGLTEEFLKIIPFVFFAGFVLHIKDPASYISFAMLGGLAFTLSEFTLHLGDDNTIHSVEDLIWLSMLHIFTGCITVYMMLLARFRWQKKQFVWFWPGLCIAVLVHGLYDYCMSNDLWIVSFLILLSGIGLLSHMLNNALSNSLVSAGFTKLNFPGIASSMLAIFIIAVTTEFLFNAITFGKTISFRILRDEIQTLSLPLFFLAVKIAQTDIVPLRWRQFSFFSAMNPFPFLLQEKNRYANYIGREIIFSGARQNALILEYLPLKGIIREREIISGYAGWFAVELNKPLTTNKKSHTRVLVRTQTRNREIKKDARIVAGIFLIPQNYDMRQEDKKQEDLIFLDWVLIS